MYNRLGLLIIIEDSSNLNEGGGNHDWGPTYPNQENVQFWIFSILAGGGLIAAATPQLGSLAPSMVTGDFNW